MYPRSSARILNFLIKRSLDYRNAKDAVLSASAATRDGYSWRNGLEEMRVNGKLPWTSLFYNDKSVLRYNIPIYPGGADKNTWQTEQPVDPSTNEEDKLWLRGRLNEVNYFWPKTWAQPATKNPTELINSGFGSFQPSDIAVDNSVKYNPASKGAQPYGVVTREQAQILKNANPNSLPNLKILLPSKTELTAFVQNKHFNDVRSNYQTFVTGVGDPSQDKDTSKKEGVDFNGIEMKGSRNPARWIKEVDNVAYVFLTPYVRALKLSISGEMSGRILMKAMG